MSTVRLLRKDPRHVNVRLVRNQAIKRSTLVWVVALHLFGLSQPPPADPSSSSQPDAHRNGTPGPDLDRVAPRSIEPRL